MAMEMLGTILYLAHTRLLQPRISTEARATIKSSEVTKSQALYLLSAKMVMIYSMVETTLLAIKKYRATILKS